MSDERIGDYAEVIVCAGPPDCLLQDDAAIEAQNAGCPKCQRIILNEDGSERQYQTKAN